MSERYVKPMVVDQGEDFITLRARILQRVRIASRLDGLLKEWPVEKWAPSLFDLERDIWIKLRDDLVTYFNREVGA